MSPVYGELPKSNKYRGEYDLAQQLMSLSDPKLHLIFNIGWIEDANEADILIWHEEAGVFVVEVKAVNLRAIKRFGRATCEIAGRKQGRSPQRQAYEAFEGLRKYLGPYFKERGENCPFIVPTACFPQISRYDWDHHWSRREVNVCDDYAKQMIFSEDLSRGPSAFRERLQHIYLNPPVRKGAFRPFSHNNKALEILTTALLAEAKPEPGVTDLERLRKIEKDVKDKTRSEAPVDGNTRLAYRGYPGTGKTFRLLGIAHEHALAGRRVLFACYNKVLASDLRRLMSFSEELKSAAGELEIRGVHELLSIESAALDIDPFESDDADGWAQLTAERVINSNDVLRYDTVLVDEAQDMMKPQNALRLLEHLCEPEGTLCVAAGTGQELYGDVPEWLNEFVERADTKILRRNFRNSEPVFRFAQTFYEARLDQKRISAALNRFKNSGSKSAEVLFERHGSLTKLCFANDEELNGYECDHPDFPLEQERVMVREYQRIIKEQLDEMHYAQITERSEEYPFDLLILVPSEKHFEYEWAKEALRTLWGGQAYTDYVLQANRRDVPRRDAVRLCTFHSARGIEGTRVIVFGLDKVREVVGAGNARFAILVTLFSRGPFSSRS